MAAPAGASAGASASFEQAAVAMVRPPITASMEASLDFFMGQTPSSLSDTQDFPLHAAASGRQAKPGQTIPASGVRGIVPSAWVRAELCVHAEGPTPSRHNSAKGSDRLHEAMVFFGTRRGRVIRWATRRATRPRPARRGVGSPAMPGSHVAGPGGGTIVRRHPTRRERQSRDRARYGRCDWNSSRSP